MTIKKDINRENLVIARESKKINKRLRKLVNWREIDSSQYNSPVFESQKCRCLTILK